MNIQDIKELILAIDKTSIHSVDIESVDGKISISKDAHHEHKESLVMNHEIETKKTVEKVEEKKEDGENIYVVKSPIVGVFYGAASPDSEPFVKVGDHIKKEQPLCIIEAMKIMNEIKAEDSGEVIEVLVSNEEVVEYGQPLMRIRR